MASSLLCITPENQRPTVRVLLCWSVVLLASLATAVGIAILAPRMAPIRPGSSHVFWKLGCGVSLSPQVSDGWGGRAYFVDDSWAAYDRSHIHGSELYYVSASDVLSDFDAVVEALQQAHERGEDSTFVQGYVNWQDDNEQPRNWPALLENIRLCRQRQLIDKDIDLLAYAVAEEQLFWQRWQRTNWYWANMVFEWTYLSGLVLFALWPGIRALSPLRWAIRIACLPVLFLLPTYLGYATFSFTSAGPSGGILYPYLLMFCRGGSVTALDRWILTHLPQVLEPLSTPIGTPIALTGAGMPGPTSAIITGVVIGGLLVGINLGYRRWMMRRS